MVKIKWTEKACSNIQAIYEFISKDSRIYATRFVNSLIDATKTLEAFPRSGRIVREFKDYGFREIIYHNYRIVYRFKSDENIVEILVVVHCAREFEKIILEN